MKTYYKLKKNNYTIGFGPDDNSVIKFYNSDKEAINDNCWLLSSVFDHKEDRCKSIEELKNAIFSDLAEEIEANLEISNLVEEIIEKIGIEKYTLSFNDKPCIVIKHIILNDQDEKIPIKYLKSDKELDNLDYNFDYEVYIIDEDGSLKLDKDLSTYDLVF